MTRCIACSSNNIGRLPVVSREDPQEMVGFFNRSNLLDAWTRQMEEEGVQEHGWFARWRGRTESVGNSRRGETTSIEWMPVFR